MKWTMLAAEAGDVPSRIHLHPTLFTLHPHTLHPTPYTLSLSIFLTPSHSLTTAGAMKWTTLAAEAGDVPSMIHLAEAYEEGLGGLAKVCSFFFSITLQPRVEGYNHP